MREKLAQLSTDKLVELQGVIEQILDARLDRTPRSGRIATFIADGDGLERTVVITRVNGKTVSCEETGASVTPGQKWRVGHSSLKVKPVEKKVPAASKPQAPHRPATAGPAVW